MRHSFITPRAALADCPLPIPAVEIPLRLTLVAALIAGLHLTATAATRAAPDQPARTTADAATKVHQALFDQRRFHMAVIDQSAMPLLEQRINAWIVSEKSRP